MKKKPAKKALAKPKKKPSPRAPKKKPLLPPGMLLLGLNKAGKIALTDSKGKTSPMFAPGDEEKLRAALADTSWSIHEGGIEIDASGACPVQGEGTVDGHPVYFRARGESWTLEIAQIEDKSAVGVRRRGDGWTFGADYGTWPEAGWMSAKHSKRCFLSAVNAWRKAGGEKAKLGPMKLSRRWPIPMEPKDP